MKFSENRYMYCVRTAPERRIKIVGRQRASHRAAGARAVRASPSKTAAFLMTRLFSTTHSTCGQPLLRRVCCRWSVSSSDDPPGPAATEKGIRAERLLLQANKPKEQNLLLDFHNRLIGAKFA